MLLMDFIILQNFAYLVCSYSSCNIIPMLIVLLFKLCYDLEVAQLYYDCLSVLSSALLQNSADNCHSILG